MTDTVATPVETPVVAPVAPVDAAPVAETPAAPAVAPTPAVVAAPPSLLSKVLKYVGIGFVVIVAAIVGLRIYANHVLPSSFVPAATSKSVTAPKPVVAIKHVAHKKHACK